MVSKEQEIYISDRPQAREALCYFIGCAFILACLNPWTSFGTNSMDSQPWALFFGVAFIFPSQRVRTPPYFVVLFISVVFGMIFSLMLSAHLAIEDVTRFVGGYAALLVVYLGFYNFLSRYGFPRRIFIFSGWSWILFALIEIVAPSVTALISPQRTSEGRGLTSLAPEPTFFAIFLIFFSWIFFRGTSAKFKASDKLLVSTSLISVLVLARSAMGVLYLATGVAMFFISVFVNTFIRGRLNKKKIVISLSFAAASTLSFHLINSIMPESRVGRILSDLVEVGPDGIVSMIRMDDSIFTRVGHAVISVHSALSNFGLPGGIDTFSIKSQDVVGWWSGLLWDFIPGDKIQSWNGTLLYELGIFGLISYVVFILAARRKGGASTAEIITVVFFLVGAIPIAFPLAPMLFALWAYRAQAHHMGTNN